VELLAVTLKQQGTGNSHRPDDSEPNASGQPSVRYGLTQTGDVVYGNEF
jgi:hypothetical protein